MRCSVYIICPAVLSCSNLKLHQTLEVKNIFKLEKVMLQLTFNPAGLTLTIADHMTQTGHRIKWDLFDILGTGQSDIHCKIKETLLIRDLKPGLNENVGGEKLLY